MPGLHRSASRTPLPRKLLGQVLYQDGFAAGTEEDMGLGSGQSPGAGTDPQASPGRRPPPSDGAQPPLSPIPMRLMTAVTVMRTAQEGDTGVLSLCPVRIHVQSSVQIRSHGPWH